MNRKYVIIVNIIIMLVLTIIAGICLYKLDYKPKDEVETEYIAEEKVTDECTEEGKLYELGVLDNEIEVSSAEEKISPNAKFIIEKNYKGCGHTKKEIAEIPYDMVNKTQEEIEELYKDFKVESFSASEITLSKEQEGICDEHYVLKENDNKIAIYKVRNDGKEELIEQTEISVEYLPQTDLINIKNGINIYGKEELNSTLEDFE